VKALVQDRYGSADVLKVEEIDPPIPDATSVLLKVRSASVNGLDWRILSGRPFMGRMIFGWSHPKRRVRGVDVAGEVVAVRVAGSRFKVGDAVFGLGSGSFAEYVAADEKEIVAKPPEISFDDASTLGIAAFTALQGLKDHAHVRAGQTVAITGAASGVGTFAVQLAKWMGAGVTAVTATENVEMLQSIGADHVVDYRKEDFARGPERYDAILDISGLIPMRALLKKLNPEGELYIVGGRGGMGPFLTAGLRRRVLRQRVHVFIAHSNVEDLTTLGRLVAEGKLKPAIERVYPLDQAPQAMARAEQHRARGKLVIHVA
jgi:NADPH:quinone reductase-like Zn-dependent oxidoreductase